MHDEHLILPPTVDALVVALCADYDRRAAALAGKNLSHRVEMELRYISFQMLDAAAEIAGERYADIYIREIGAKIGYAHSDVPYLSEGTYKAQKHAIKVNLARKLHLLDL